MANTHSIEILNLQIAPEYEGKTSVVKQINFNVVATNEKNESYKLQKICVLPLDDLNNFVDFKNLTENLVKQWIVEHFNPESLNQFYVEADAGLEAQSNPPVAFVNVPWA